MYQEFHETLRLGKPFRSLLIHYTGESARLRAGEPLADSVIQRITHELKPLEERFGIESIVLSGHGVSSERPYVAFTDSLEDGFSMITLDISDQRVTFSQSLLRSNSQFEARIPSEALERRQAVANGELPCMIHAWVRHCFIKCSATA